MDMKNCKHCSKEFHKKTTDSRKTWALKRFCSIKCAGLYNKPAQKLIGIKRPKEVVEKMKATMFKKGLTPWNKGSTFERFRGENHHNWKGGAATEAAQIRRSMEYRLWRTSVFERDDYTCIWCGTRSAKGVKVILHADHIKRFADYPELRLAIDNGRTLCEPCHRTTDTYGFKTKTI